MPFTKEYVKLVKELFKGKIGKNSRVMPPLTCICADMVSIGDNVVVMNNCLMMSRGTIIIEDGALIAANVQLISNNHDLYERHIITCKPVRICKNAWIGAGATILPGVTVGENAVVGAGSGIAHQTDDNGQPIVPRTGKGGIGKRWRFCIDTDDIQHHQRRFKRRTAQTSASSKL